VKKLSFNLDLKNVEMSLLSKFHQNATIFTRVIVLKLLVGWMNGWMDRPILISHHFFYKKWRTKTLHLLLYNLDACLESLICFQDEYSYVLYGTSVVLNHTNFNPFTPTDNYGMLRVSVRIILFWIFRVKRVNTNALSQSAKNDKNPFTRILKLMPFANRFWFFI